MTDIDIPEIERRKRYLKRYKKNNALIDRLENKLSMLDERIYSLRSPIISDMPKGGAKITNEDLIAEKKELEDRINRLLLKGRTYKGEILEKIDELEDPRYAEILEAFFIDLKGFEEIGENMGYTTRHVIRLYSEAIASMSF